MDEETTVEQRVHTGRKLYLVPLVLEIQDGPTGYKEKVETYWKEVAEHVSKLEVRFGQISKVYHESITEGGDAGLKVIESLNPIAYRMIDRKIKKGAELATTEDLELLRETLDWGRCLAMVSSDKALRLVSSLYHEASHKRIQAIRDRLDTDLQDEEAALLIMGQDQALQFPADIQVFYVSPPSLDEIRRLLREHTARRDRDAPH